MLIGLSKFIIVTDVLHVREIFSIKKVQCTADDEN